MWREIKPGLMIGLTAALCAGVPYWVAAPGHGLAVLAVELVLLAVVGAL